MMQRRTLPLSLSFTTVLGSAHPFITPNSNFNTFTFQGGEGLVDEEEEEGEEEEEEVDDGEEYYVNHEDEEEEGG